MKKFFVLAVSLLSSGVAFCQNPTGSSTGPGKVNVAIDMEKKAKKEAESKKLVGKLNDHFVFQVGTENWGGAPDSIANRTKTINKSFNVYVMLNKPFKSNPKFSLAYGIGIGTSNVFFKKTGADIGATGTRLNFPNLDSANSYKKFKLSYAYLEVPLELRFNNGGENNRNGFKAALGLKVGTLVNGHTKGKELQNRNGNTLNTNIDKVSTRKFFNGTRIAATARVGYGIFSLYASYAFTNVFKDGVAAPIKPIQVGLTISGL